MRRRTSDLVLFIVGSAFLIANVVLLMAGLATPMTYVAIVTLAIAVPMSFCIWRNGTKR